jgi:HD superfamily phosphohydrolase
MHSDLDADRMDYLIRDSHYTGLKYGQFDREYILANLTTFDAGKSNLAFGIRENAMAAVDDFLIARFSWYSQIIKNPGSAKFDIMSSHVAKGLLEGDLIHQFHDLLGMIEEKDERFFWWNDIYFMNRLQEVRMKKQIKDPTISELTEMLLYRHPPKTVIHPLFAHRILGVSHNQNEKDQLVSKIMNFVHELESVLKRHGTGKEWLLADIPQKDVVFTSGIKNKVKRGTTDTIVHERDPIKVVAKDGTPSLLVQRDNTLMKHLSGFINFVPSVYANEPALKLLQARKMIDK